MSLIFVIIRKYNTDNILHALIVLCNISSQLQSLATRPTELHFLWDEGERVYLYIPSECVSNLNISSTRKTNTLRSFFPCFYFCIKCSGAKRVGGDC